MHIPDSVLSPSTCTVCAVAMLPVWAVAGRQVHTYLKTRQVPLLALGAAFCFTIMMFNIPALGGTTAHPVAGTLLAVLLGPWAAVIGISVALAIQALFFGDGGILAYGANCFTMAFVLPFVGYSVYYALSSRLQANSRRRPFCAALGSYIGINAAAAVVGLLLGIQPALFHESNGHALYFPFGLSITLPAMLGSHLLIAGPAEAIVTALVVVYLQSARIPLYRQSERSPVGSAQAGNSAAPSLGKRGRSREALWVGLLALIALSPLGLLAKGDAWGEWDAEDLKAQIKQQQGVDYLPRGVAAGAAKEYRGIGGLNDYASDKGARGYLGAGVLGAGVIVLLLLGSGRLLARREAAPPLQPDPPIPSASAGGGTNAEDALPDWLHRPALHESGAGGANGVKADARPANRYLARTLAEVAGNSAVALNGETWARQAGYLQRLDPRAKVLTVFGLIGVTTCLHRPLTLLCLYGLTLGLAAVSRLPLGLLLKRVWLSVPLFVGALTLPAALNTVTPGRELLLIWPHPHLAFTAPGLLLALILTLRVGVAVSLATLLTLTTAWNDLLRALRALGAPRLFLVVLAMTYRYTIVLLQSAGEMFTARLSRTVGRATNSQGRRFVGASIGALFGKSLTLAEEVHAAMVSRGFTGEVRTLARPRWRLADSLWALAMLLVAVAALGGERLWGGHA